MYASAIRQSFAPGGSMVAYVATKVMMDRTAYAPSESSTIDTTASPALNPRGHSDCLSPAVEVGANYRTWGCGRSNSART
ncbi:hypothetical protein PX52LOC_04606 [Limnoglobus roseus]|uniref:Uncharacterized protein n=1 Tax=Limnoglobus roseus TaxID=2598579 RepID=A0A5C1AFL5_9BACT|nr:hypothetical protein PX52LOC_04606 [Limnoglobus roseus]